MTREKYTPKKGSIAATVIDYFRRNPTETIFADDMFIKFSLSQVANIRMELLDAYTTDLLMRREINGEYEYSAGKRLLAELIEVATDKPARKAATNKASTLPAISKPPVVGFPDPLTVPVDDDVAPVSMLRGTQRICWLPLLARLAKVNQSAELPLRCKSTLSKSITDAHKAGPAKYSTRVDKQSGTVRVWRVA
jgi:hypothetical protein